MDMDNAVIGIVKQGSTFTFREFYHAMRQGLQNMDHAARVSAQQSMDALVANQRGVASVELDMKKSDLRKTRRQLKKAGIDFKVTRSWDQRGAGECTLWFKYKDSEKMKEAFSQQLAEKQDIIAGNFDAPAQKPGAIPAAKDKASLIQRIDQAKEKAKVHNMAQQAQKSVQKTWEVSK